MYFVDVEKKQILVHPGRSFYTNGKKVEVDGSYRNLFTCAMKNRRPDTGSKLPREEEIDLEGLSCSWEDSTRKFCGVFSPIVEADKLVLADPFEWYSTEAEDLILTLFSNEFSGYNEKHIMTCSNCSSESINEQKTKSMVINCYGGMEKVYTMKERMEKGFDANVVLRRCSKSCCGDEDVPHNYHVERVLMEGGKSPPFLFFNINAYELQGSQAPMVAKAKEMEVAACSSVLGGKEEEAKKIGKRSAIKRRVALNVDEKMELYGEEYILYNIIFFKPKPYHYWLGGRQKNDWYEIGLKECSATKITVSRMRALKHGNIKGLVYVKCEKVIPQMLSSLRDVLAESYGEARPCCTDEEWEDAVPLMEEFCTFYTSFLIRLFQNYLNVTCYLQALLICLVNLPPVKKICLNRNPACCVGANVVCDCCVFQKAVQKYCNLSLHDLDFWNNTYVPQFEAREVPRIEGYITN